jgi:ABC transporter with metal-binding/Fe-S-binding domain ATP-binding protein
MKCGILFSGGKDSVFAAYLAKKHGNEITCLITIISENPDSYMFHTPSITKVKKQAEAMNVPLIIQKTKGEKEKELKDLEFVIKKAKRVYNIEAIVTGSVESAYQASRVQKICDNLELDCFNPLWQKDQFELLYDLIDNNFNVIITGVFAYPLNKSWLGREINNEFISDVTELFKKYKINPSGEGGEFESFVLNCPIFSRVLKIKDSVITGSKNSWRMDIEVI